MRHGQARHNLEDYVDSKVTSTVALTEHGREQVVANTHRLRLYDIDTIISSPLLRTRQTAGIVAEAVGIQPSTIIEEHNLREMDCGHFEGASYKGYCAQFLQPLDRYYKNPHGGESEEDVYKRIHSFLHTLCDDPKQQGKTLLLVTHGTPIRVAYLALTGAPLESVYEGEQSLCPTGQYLAFSLEARNRRSEALWERFTVTLLERSY